MHKDAGVTVNQTISIMFSVILGHMVCEFSACKLVRVFFSFIRLKGFQLDLNTAFGIMLLCSSTMFPLLLWQHKAISTHDTCFLVFMLATNGNGSTNTGKCS